MSMAAVLFLAAAPAMTSPSPEVANEIRVIGRRMKGWRGRVIKQDGELACRTRTSTGDKDVDAIRCGSMLACIGPLEGQMDAIANSDMPTAERNRRMSELSMSAAPCMDAYHDRAVAALAAQRAAR